MMALLFFPIVKNENESANTLNNDLLLISKWAYNWKLLFNPDPSKQAQEVLFSIKMKTQIHPTISFNNIQVKRASHHKHLGILLDEKLNFKQHKSVIKKLRHSLPRKSLMTIYKFKAPN